MIYVETQYIVNMRNVYPIAKGVTLLSRTRV